MTVWYTADLHLGHEMVAEYRGFKSAHGHDKAILEAYNDKVGEKDTVYIVGDLSLWGPEHKGHIERALNRMKGKKHLILGNHDKLKPFDYVEMGIISVHTALEVRAETQEHVPQFMGYRDLTLVHDPSAAATDISKDWVCGHVHSLFTRIGKVVNVGVDVWDLEPLNQKALNNLFLDAEPTEEQLTMVTLAARRHELKHMESIRDPKPTGPASQLGP